jgi:hypothetical protein
VYRVGQRGEATADVVVTVRVECHGSVVSVFGRMIGPC